MILYGILIVLIIAVEQIIKYAVKINVGYGESITVIPKVLSVTYTENRGAAFGILRDKPFIFFIAGIIVILIFAYMVFVKNVKNKMFLLSATLIVAGGIGNLVDRILYGYVIDYLQLSFFPPVCNLSDYCITAGAILLVLYLLFFMDSDNRAKCFEKEK